MQFECFYRLANAPAASVKSKLPLASKEACLANFICAFRGHNITVLGDCINSETSLMVERLGVRLVHVREGSGAGSFRQALSMALILPDEAFTYLVEDDFLHAPGAASILMDGLSMGHEYVTLYDHPGHYMNGLTRHIRNGGEKTRLLKGNACHWKISNSTVMTFASSVRQLRQDKEIILKHCTGRFTDDYKMFRHLAWRGRTLISSVPGFSTHCELEWLSPFRDWQSDCQRPLDLPGSKGS